jgi:type IV pilus assembly protein PilM
LATEAAAEVESINPFQNFHLDGKGLDDAYIQQIRPQAAISMGLAMRKVDDK